MAKKKPRRDDDKPRRPPRRKPPDELPDRRTLEKVLQGIVGGPDPETPLGQAQDLIYQAFEERDPQRRVELAREALTFSPDCADAYVLLAENASSRKAALQLYEKGGAAGERVLGKGAFTQDAGHFWGLLETRPYMRARQGLAHALWTAGRRDEAVVHAEEMLRLNPSDNQGIRYTLAAWLLNLDRDEDLARLLEQYADEGSATWAYTRALLAFRQGGDTPEARRLLTAAKKSNRHVPAYLLGEKFPPAEQPPYYSFGDESEAVQYIGSFIGGWRATPGAVAWLRKAGRSRKREERPKPRGPLKLVKKWLKDRLTQGEDVWQVAWREAPLWLNTDGEQTRPWLLLVTNRTEDLVLAHDVLPELPSANHVWDALVRAMQNPAAGEPHRPAELEVRADASWESLQPHLKEIGVRLTVSENLEQMDTAMASLGAHLGGKPYPGLLDVPGVGPAQAAAFYEAAAYFFRQAPWRKVGYESAIKVECAKFESSPWYAIVMGQSGLVFGLAVYENYRILRQMWAEDANEEKDARRSVATTVTFNEAWEIPIADFDAARQHGWVVAREDAYPFVFHKDRGFSRRPPLAWELELMEALMRAVPGFVERRRQDDATREEVTVPVAGGELTLGLSWIQEDEVTGP